MKIRTDYVSNSSSSSFVIVGKVYSLDEVIKAVAKSDPEVAEAYGDGELDSYEIVDKLESLGDISIATAGYDAIDEVLIGLDPDKMSDSQTLKEFKQQAKAAIEKVGLKASLKDIKFVSGGSEASGLSYFGACG